MYTFDEDNTTFKCQISNTVYMNNTCNHGNDVKQTQIWSLMVKDYYTQNPQKKVIKIQFGQSP